MKNRRSPLTIYPETESKKRKGLVGTTVSKWVSAIFLLLWPGLPFFHPHKLVRPNHKWMCLKVCVVVEGNWWDPPLAESLTPPPPSTFTSYGPHPVRVPSVWPTFPLHENLTLYWCLFLLLSLRGRVHQRRWWNWTVRLTAFGILGPTRCS